MSIMRCIITCNCMLAVFGYGDIRHIEMWLYCAFGIATGQFVTDGFERMATIILSAIYSAIVPSYLALWTYSVILHWYSSICLNR